MMGLAREMEKVCPNAWLIQSGNPVYEGTNLMLRETSIKVIGLCHGHYGYFNIAKVMGLDPAKIRWIAPGLNHLIWLNEFRYDGQDAYPLLDEWIANRAEAYWKDRIDHPENYLDHVSGEEDQMSRAVVDQYRRFGLLPLGDTTRGGGWWYKTDLETRLHWYGPTGGFGSDAHMPPFLKRHYAKVAAIHDVVSDPQKSVLAAFPPIKTHEQQVPIIDALANDVQGYFQINVFNMGALPGVADNVVTEIPAIIDKGGIHRVQVNPLPKKIMLEVIQPSILSMEWQLEAFLKGDRRLWLEGLLMLNTYMSGGHTHTYQQAVDYMNDMFAQPWNREMAEHFK
jgi:alpha-galactosidase